MIPGRPDVRYSNILPVQGKKDAFIFMADRWKQWDLADSRYVWVPLRFNGAAKPVVEWRDSWTS